MLFLDYLKHEKNVKDPDVLMFYALIDKDIFLAKEALEQKGNVDITFEEILKRYEKEYKLYPNYKKRDYQGIIIVDNEFEEVK